MRFADSTQQEVFVRACKGNHHMLPLLPPDLAKLAGEANRLHNARGCRGGSNQDPLHVRAKWAARQACLRLTEPYELALHAIAGIKMPACKCRTCHLRKAAKVMRQYARPATIAGRGPHSRAFIFSKVWAHFPEAALTREDAMVSMWLNRGNEALERGVNKTAQRCFDKAQERLDHANAKDRASECPSR